MNTGAVECIDAGNTKVMVGQYDCGTQSTLLACVLWVEVVAFGIFSLDYVMCLFHSTPMLRYAASFIGLIDACTLISFLLNFFASQIGHLGFVAILRSFKALRIQRLVRVRSKNRLLREDESMNLQLFETASHLAISLLVLVLIATGVVYALQESIEEREVAFHKNFGGAEILQRTLNACSLPQVVCKHV